MVYLKWLALMPASFIMAIVGRLLAPILPFFVDKETHRLPNWLSWFATDDNDADGDQGHWERWPGTDPLVDVQAPRRLASAQCVLRLRHSSLWRLCPHHRRMGSDGQ